MNINFTCCCDNALGDHVTAHDAAKDIDQYAFDIAIGEDELERFCHAFARGAAAHI